MKAINAPKFSMPKAYRHFAVVTVALTTLMAVFADGENREAISKTVEDQRQDQDLHREEAEKYGRPVLKIKDSDSSKGGGHFASDAETGAGLVMVGGGGGSYSQHRSRAGVGARVAAGAYRRQGITDEQLAKLTPGERDALLESLEEKEAAPAEREVTQTDLDRLMAASALRSGSEAGSED